MTIIQRLRSISKFIVALFTAIVIAAQAPATDGKITSGEWVAIVVSLLGSGVVFAVSNDVNREKTQGTRG